MRKILHRIGQALENWADDAERGRLGLPPARLPELPAAGYDEKILTPLRESRDHMHHKSERKSA